MELLTAKILKQLPPLYSQEKNKDPIAWVKFFTPWSNWTWYATEYDPKEKLFFGLVKGFETELEYFSLQELESVQGPAGLKIERDRFFSPTRLSELRQQKNPHAGTRKTTTVFQLLQLKSAIGLELKGLKHSKGSAINFTRRLFGVDALRPRVTPQDLIAQCEALIASAKAAGAGLLTPFQINIEGMTYDNPKGLPWMGQLSEKCEMCGGPYGREMYDAPSEGRGSPWGNLCRKCWQRGGGQLGLGLGQKYVLKGGKWVQEAGGGAGRPRKNPLSRDMFNALLVETYLGTTGVYGGLPQGHFYAKHMDKINLDDLQQLIALAVKNGLITTSGHLMKATPKLIAVLKD